MIILTKRADNLVFQVIPDLMQIVPNHPDMVEHYAQFHIDAIADGAEPAGLRPGWQRDPATGALSKTAAIIAKEADDTTEPQRRVAAHNVIAELRQIAGGTFAGTNVQALRVLAHATLYLLLRDKRRDEDA